MMPGKSSSHKNVEMKDFQFENFRKGEVQ